MSFSRGCLAMSWSSWCATLHAKCAVLGYEDDPRLCFSRVYGNDM